MKQAASSCINTINNATTRIFALTPGKILTGSAHRKPYLSTYNTVKVFILIFPPLPEMPVTFTVATHPSN
jgi:hypothetical protein